jgi:hypothetical protein
MEDERLAHKGGEAPSGSDATTTGAAPPREKRSKLAADPTLAKGPIVPEADAVSTEAIVHAARHEELVRTATQLPLPSLTFAMMHKALGDLHAVSMASTQSPRVDLVWRAGSSLFPFEAIRLAS